MATLLRSLSLQGRSLRVLSKVHPTKATAVPFLKHKALISTSKKNKDVSASIEPMEKSADLKRLTEHFENTDSKNEENFTSYGFEPGDRDTDWFYYNLVMFGVFTIGFCWGGFILAYMPDYKMLDWCQREAFLELERREKEGLPLVDPNYVNVDTIELPSDEELGDEEIII
ncbi:chitin deacetylase [Plakobranchus ocellatus]|uniref:NADH dehydrogenase [ubiquinone] 1 beta subcomplex subunit 11, mitochondrial n=1 Tax=Plakobranchus ocellatus TaxID=259542 RepID=A0AAV4DKB9_9GAST|nr:chitin deacetylase [Plakobranchus ocellatus]